MRRTASKKTRARPVKEASDPLPSFRQRVVDLTSGTRRIPSWAVGGFMTFLLLILGASFLTKAHLSGLNGDIVGFEKISIDLATHTLGDNGLYYHFHHYPPLANLLFLFVRYNAFVFPYDWGLLITTIMCGIAALLFMWEFCGTDSARWTFLSILLTIVLLEPSTFFARFDFFPLLCIVLCALSLRAERWQAVGSFLALGFLLKFAPIFLTPLVLAMTPRKSWMSVAKAFFSTILVVWLVHDLVLEPGEMIRSFSAFATSRSAQPPYVFSTAASIDIFFQRLRGSMASIAWIEPNLGHFVTDMPASLPLMLQIFTIGGAVLIALLAVRDPHRRRNVTAYTGATMCWLLFATPFATMHYYLWALPFGFIWFFERTEGDGDLDRWTKIVCVLTAAISLLGQYTFPYGYYPLVLDQSWLPVIINFSRNILMLVLCIAFLEAARERTATAR